MECLHGPEASLPSDAVWIGALLVGPVRFRVAGPVYLYLFRPNKGIRGKLIIACRLSKTQVSGSLRLSREGPHSCYSCPTRVPLDFDHDLLLFVILDDVGFFLFNQFIQCLFDTFYSLHLESLSMLLSRFF